MIFRVKDELKWAQLERARELLEAVKGLLKGVQEPTLYNKISGLARELEVKRIQLDLESTIAREEAYNKAERPDS